MRYDVFISYATRDREWVQFLVDNLRLCDLRVFFDAEGIAPGMVWTPALEQALRDSRHVVLVVSPASLASGWVGEEVYAALRRAVEGKVAIHPLELFPVTAAGHADLPDFVANRQVLSVFADSGDWFGRLAKALKGASYQPPGGLAAYPAVSAYGDPGFRNDLVALGVTVCETARDRIALASACGLQPHNVLAALPNHPLAVSAALERMRQANTWNAAAERFLGVLDELGVATDAASALRARLRALTDPATDQESLIERFLVDVAEVHGKALVHFGRKAATDDLETMWVELRVGGVGTSLARAESRRGAGKGKGKRRGLLLEDLLDPETFESESSMPKRWLLRGDPGSGKTTLLRRFAARLASNPERRFVPVFVELPRLIASGKTLAGLLDEDYSGGGFEGLGAEIEALGERRELLVLLDGLDEVRREDQHRVDIVVRNQLRSWPNATWVVATRRIGAEGCDLAKLGFRDVDLLPLDTERKLDFLEAWFASAPWGDGSTLDAASAVQRIESVESLKRLSDCPLYLTLFALLLENDTDLSRLNRPLALHEEVFELLCEGLHRPGGRPMPDKLGGRRLLAAIAHAMTEEDLVAAMPDEIELLIGAHCADAWRAIEDCGAWRGDKRKFLEEQARCTSILAAHDGERSETEGFGRLRRRPWRFWHKSFREALTAADLQERSEDELLERAAKIGDDAGRWAEPFALFLSGLDDEIALGDWLRRFKEQNANLALRALSSVRDARLSEEVVIDLLGAVDADGDRRETAFRDVLQLVGGDVEAAVGVIERLVDLQLEQDWNGQEMWYLDDALEGLLAAERCDDALTKRIDRLRGRILEHPQLGARPGREAVDGMAVPGHPGVAYWCRIEGERLRFRMGSHPADSEAYYDEKPAHDVTIARSFEIAAVAVTNEQWKRFLPAHEYSEGLADHPVVEVSWYDAWLYCRWLGARLPTEAEWECSARGGEATRYSFGDDAARLAEHGWFDANSRRELHAVAQKQPNPYGLYDVHGNVYEWCHDRWHDGYAGAPTDGRAWENDGSTNRVVRGGSFGDDAGGCRSAFRFDGPPSDRFVALGFRPARFVTE